MIIGKCIDIVVTRPTQRVGSLEGPYVDIHGPTSIHYKGYIDDHFHILGRGDEYICFIDKEYNLYAYKQNEIDRNIISFGGWITSWSTEDNGSLVDIITNQEKPMDVADFIKIQDDIVTKRILEKSW